MLFPAGADAANGLSGSSSIWLLQLEIKRSNPMNKEELAQCQVATYMIVGICKKLTANMFVPLMVIINVACLCRRSLAV